MDNLLLEMMDEYSCVEDCLEQMKIHMRRGDYELANERCLDIQRSFKTLDSIQQKITMRKKVFELNQRGVSAKVVKRSV